MLHRTLLEHVAVATVVAGLIVGCGEATVVQDLPSDTANSGALSPPGETQAPAGDPTSEIMIPTAEDALQLTCTQLDEAPDWNQIAELEPVDKDPFYAEQLLLWGDVAREEYARILTDLDSLTLGDDLRVARLTRDVEHRLRMAEILTGDARYFLERPSQQRYRILLMGYGGYLRSIELDPPECTDLQ